PVNIKQRSFAEVVAEKTEGWGADVVFEASGSPRAFDGLFDLVRPGGAAVLVGLPVEKVAFDVAGAISKEVRIETVFRYANIFDRALELIASDKVDLKPLITETFDFKQSIAAFERAAQGNPSDVKLQIRVAAEG
ncbi:MAG TPA: zinc-binding dehydrogenase, partial [Pseudorhizobium sp.]|nr:zinc-binding dehydrogenase [Pseudorhizobium sp.]